MLNEIKFACPYCNQHIACDAGYRNFNIDCPACGNSMVVPHLSPGDPAHPQMVVVASTPAPKRREPPPLPAVKGWTQQEWEPHSRNLDRGGNQTAPHWIFSFIGTLIVLFVFRAHGAGILPLLLCLILGIIVSAILMAKDRKSTQAYSLLKGLQVALTVAIILPVIALGILFIGCLTVMH